MKLEVENKDIILDLREKAYWVASVMEVQGSVLIIKIWKLSLPAYKSCKDNSYCRVLWPSPL